MSEKPLSSKILGGLKSAAKITVACAIGVPVAIGTGKAISTMGLPQNVDILAAAGTSILLGGGAAWAGVKGASKAGHALIDMVKGEKAQKMSAAKKAAIANHLR